MALKLYVNLDRQVDGGSGSIRDSFSLNDFLAYLANITAPLPLSEDTDFIFRGRYNGQIIIKDLDGQNNKMRMYSESTSTSPAIFTMNTELFYIKEIEYGLLVFEDCTNMDVDIFKLVFKEGFPIINFKDSATDCNSRVFNNIFYKSKFSIDKEQAHYLLLEDKNNINPNKGDLVIIPNYPTSGVDLLEIELDFKILFMNTVEDEVVIISSFNYNSLPTYGGWNLKAYKTAGTSDWRLAWQVFNLSDSNPSSVSIYKDFLQNDYSQRMTIKVGFQLVPTDKVVPFMEFKGTRYEVTTMNSDEKSQSNTNEIILNGVLSTPSDQASRILNSGCEIGLYNLNIIAKNSSSSIIYETIYRSETSQSQNTLTDESINSNTGDIYFTPIKWRKDIIV